MSLSGSVTSTSSKSRSVTLNWTATQSVTNNTSTISWELVGSGSATGRVVVSELRVTIDGSEVFYRNEDHHTDCYQGTVLASGTKTISHNTDGSRSFSVNIQAGIYEHLINCTGSGTFTLNTIPRASSISVSGSITLGSAKTISINSASSAFKHTITWVFGSQSGTIATKTASTSLSWTPSINLCDELPDSTSGTGTLTCKTYSGENLIGTKSISFTAKVPSSVAPSVSTFSATRVDNDVPSSWGIYVQNHSQCRLSVTASGAHGSTIKSYTIKQGSEVLGTSRTLTTEVLNSVGSITYTVTVTDSRKRTASKTVTINVVEYSVPTIASVLSQRCNSSGSLNDDGTYIKATCSFTYSSCDSHNTITSKVSFRQSGTSSWSTAVDFASGTAVVIAGSASVDYSYEVKYEVTDAFGAITYTDIVSTAKPTMDFKKGGKGVAFGKVSESTEWLESAWNMMIENDNPSMRVISPEKTIGLLVNSPISSNPKNGGLYDFTNSLWILYTDADGNIHIGTSAVDNIYVGSKTVGNSRRPIYLAGGVPTATEFGKYTDRNDESTLDDAVKADMLAWEDNSTNHITSFRKNAYYAIYGVGFSSQSYRAGLVVSYNLTRPKFYRLNDGEWSSEDLMFLSDRTSVWQTIDVSQTVSCSQNTNTSFSMTYTRPTGYTLVGWSVSSNHSSDVILGIDSVTTTTVNGHCRNPWSSSALSVTINVKLLFARSA